MKGWKRNRSPQVMKAIFHGLYNNRLQRLMGFIFINTIGTLSEYPIPELPLQNAQAVRATCCWISGMAGEDGLWLLQKKIISPLE